MYRILFILIFSCSYITKTIGQEEQRALSIEDSLLIYANDFHNSNNHTVYEYLFMNFTKHQYWSSESKGEDDIYFAYSVYSSYIKKDRDYKYLTPIVNSLNMINIDNDSREKYAVYMLGSLFKEIVNDEILSQALLSSFMETYKESNPNMYKNLKLIYDR